jgi:hypothetical protein
MMLPSLASSEVLAVRYAVRLWHPSCLAFAAPARIRNELSRHGRGGMRCHKFISLFGGVAAAWSFAAHAQDSATTGTTSAPTSTSTQIEVAHVKPVDQISPGHRLGDNLIDLMKDFSLSSAQGVGGAWRIPPRALTPFDARYGQW